jgi:hypothetical protein
MALTWNRNRMDLAAFFLGGEKNGRPEIHAKLGIDALLDEKTGDVAASIKECEVDWGNELLKLEAPSAVTWGEAGLAWTPISLASRKRS